MPECLSPNFYYPDIISEGAFVMTKDLIKLLLETLEQYSGPILDIEDIFLNRILAEKAGIKSYDSNKFLFSEDCQTRRDFCILFITISLIYCNIANDILKFWNKLKQLSIRVLRIEPTVYFQCYFH
jgi:hypothetical protein